jgi:hypothetical protein
VGLDVGVLGAEELTDPTAGQVRTEPVAAITAREAKFSEAMSCRPVHCRSSSRSMMAKSSGSTLTTAGSKATAKV